MHRKDIRYVYDGAIIKTEYACRRTGMCLAEAEVHGMKCGSAWRISLQLAREEAAAEKERGAGVSHLQQAGVLFDNDLPEAPEEADLRAAQQLTSASLVAG